MTIRRQQLLATTLFSVATLLIAPSVAAAQDASGQNESTEVEELVITGSRIPRPNLEQPTPVSSINAAAIENSGSSSLGDVLAQLPALSSSGTVRANSDSGANLGGLSFPDLRSLGTSRTLTLVNGKRHVAGDAGDTAVDLNTIPTALVDRVEVVTGGASAIYGSDAVTGVINIILKDHFTGYQVGVQAGRPENGSYGENFSAYATGGWDFSGGKANVTLTVFGDRQNPVHGPDIEGLADWATIANPADTGPNDGIPDRLFRPYIQSEYFGPNGALTAFDSDFNVLGAAALFDRFGNPVAPPPRLGENNLFYGAFAQNCDYCRSTDYGATVVPRIDRWGLDSTQLIEITPHLRFRGDVKYVRSRIADTSGSSFTEFDYLLDADNAFITPAIQAVLDQYPAGTYFGLGRDNWDIGQRGDDTFRRTWRAVGAFEGDFDAKFANLDWEASFNYGRTSNKFHSFGGLIPGNFYSAIDAVLDPATNTIRCRRDVPSTWYAGYDPDYFGDVTPETCLPFNPFGQQNTQAAIDYVTYEGDRSHTITQRVANISFTGDSSRFLNLQGGPLAFAFGAEWRREHSKNINDPFVQTGITESAPQPDAVGGFEVKEAFLELDAPILKDAPWAYRLSLNAAIRAADYSHAGNTTAWKAGFTYAPVADVLFRGTYSKAVRAPNITEAFLPPTSGFNAIFDPCDINSINEDPDRPANCQALGVNFDLATDNQFPGVTSGNANLRPEEAETWTAGVVLQPRFAPGLSITADYYDIQIKDAISFLDPQDAADKCVSGPALAMQYCDLIIRDPDTRQIVSYISSFLNQAELVAKGWDIQVSYGREFWRGRLTGSINANYIQELRTYAFQDFPDEVDIEEGELGDPRWSFITSLTYDRGPFSLTWESQYIDRSRRNADVSTERYDRPYVPSQWYHDIIGHVRIPQHEGMEVYLGVNNVFDKHIPLGVTGNTSSEASYDIYGRYWFTGVRAKF